MKPRALGSVPAESGVIKEISANKAVVRGFLRGEAEDMRVNQICLKSKGSLFIFSVCPDLFNCSLHGLFSSTGCLSLLALIERPLVVGEHTRCTKRNVILQPITVCNGKSIGCI